jgi:hypothetical protein
MNENIETMKGTVWEVVPTGLDKDNRFMAEVPQRDPQTNEIETCCVRIFDSRVREDDASWFWKLPRTGKLLPIKFGIYDYGKGEADYVASAMRLEEQPKILRDFIECEAKERKPSQLLKQIRDDVAIVKAIDIDPLGHWIDNNPAVILTKSQQRVRGKTDKELMTIVNIFAKRKGVKPCDVINAVMWNAVHDGSIWKTQLEEDDAQA